MYQIDCGLGSLNAFTNAGLRFDDLTSMFITHLHTDHIVDYFSFFLSGGYTAAMGKGNPNPAIIDPTNLTPGLAATTAALQEAFAYTNNIFENRPPRMASFPVMSDENVTVTATLVSHYDVYPAFAFRFDLNRSGTSVTFSGDTTKSDNVIALARDTDVLVHEAQFSLDDAYYGNGFRRATC